MEASSRQERIAIAELWYRRVQHHIQNAPLGPALEMKLEDFFRKTFTGNSRENIHRARCADEVMRALYEYSPDDTDQTRRLRMLQALEKNFYYGGRAWVRK